MTRLLALTTPAAGDVADAAELTRAVGDLGSLALVMAAATLVLVFLSRGVFGWLTEREKRIAVQPKPAGRNNTPPAGTPGVGVIHADLRALEERIRALEYKEASSSTQMTNLRDEMRKDMETLKQSSEAQSEALHEMAKAVERLRQQMEWYTQQRQP
jgi:hypothetical protein